MPQQRQFIELLNEEWLRRQKTNRRYSLRAYANSLGLSPSRLSDLLNGKGGLSARRATEVAERLGLPDDELEELHLLIQSELAGAECLKAFAKRKLRGEKDKRFSYGKTLASRTIIEKLSWEHLYVTELVSDVFQTESQLARRLGLHRAHLANVLKEAEELQLIERCGDRDGSSDASWKAMDPSLRFGGAKASMAIRNLHYQMLKQIPRYTEGCELLERELSTSLLQLDPSQVEALRTMILSFVKSCLAQSSRRATRAAALRTKNENSKRLYGLSIQLFPIESQGGRK